jgi:phosphoglucosamine mutase
MRKLFGTDGIRAIAGTYPLDYASIHTLGNALVELLRNEALEPKILIGRDTRESGVWMEQALFHGILEAKGSAVSAGILPTSSISYLTKKHSFSAGIVISASHNPYQDNGIKVFSSQGYKISEDWEARLEKAILRSGNSFPEKQMSIRPDTYYMNDYKAFLKSQAAHIRPSKKMKVVLDCSNGASFAIAPDVMKEAGFDVLAVNDSPDGRNINKGCGSLHPQKLAETVVKVHGDIGIAYDGDADRAIWVDERGRILNGDYTLFILAQFMREKGRLRSNTVVATSMSNMGLETALHKMGLRLVRTKVGDKYVLEKMIAIKSNLGGEQSGHTIFLDDCPTGDGILTSLKMLEVLAVRELPLSGLVEDFLEYPQILLNVPVTTKIDFEEIPEISEAIDEVQRLLKGMGRLDVRYSGTEPLARVMVEGENLDVIQKYAHRIGDAIAKNLGK